MTIEFGRARLAEFFLDDAVIHLNHGSFGAVPRPVQAAQDDWRRRLERNATRFYRTELPAALRAAAEDVAGFLGGAGRDWVFVDNATAGVNAVVASLALEPGDEILTSDHAYGAVRKALGYYAGRRGARVIEAPLPLPLADGEVVLDAVARRLSPRTRLAVFDHVTSRSAIRLPVAGLARICGERGVPLCIDGAHAPGMLHLDVPALGVDWYVGNAHKWLSAPRGSGLLWCAPARQADLHPLVISHGLGQGYIPEFDWTGTRDPSAWLSVPAAIAYHQHLGGAELRRRNRALAVAGGHYLAQAWGGEMAAPDDLLGAMATVRLPSAAPGDPEAANDLQIALSTDHGIEASVGARDGVFWIRASAHVYNEMADFRHLASALLEDGTQDRRAP